ncbi:hypothetical protein [Salibacterium qingdaonense]|uniref:Uncharacterized protein n=1 Tax=Salibacterium qingdaonense TaxID=266892 RepID=A0A1I4PLR8_9BACI|nr:hypothetical protein [Salibacterium qingdaonense]SFM28495.1 hypothetical protein SAMN04488054_12819 [Salibacterium qingdaonense]
MITPYFPVHLSERLEAAENKELVDCVLHIIAVDPFESNMEVFEFFMNDNKQYVLRSQQDPERCKGYQIPVAEAPVATTMYVKKDEEHLSLSTSLDECVEI